MPLVPELVTERLVLRGHRASDHAPAVEIWQDERVYRHITGTSASAQDVWLKLLRYGGLWDMLGYGYWAVEDRASGAYVGQLGFADFKRGLEGVEDHWPEAGWALHPDWSGRGYATEGMAAACAWLDGETRWTRSFCIMSPANGASMRLAQKLGYVFSHDTELAGEVTSVHCRNARTESIER